MLAAVLEASHIASTRRAVGAGGDAVYCQTPITIIVDNGGEIRSGGGGGGGGGAWYFAGGGDETYFPGGGGGGFPNGAGANPGAPSGGGAGQAGALVNWNESGTATTGAGGGGGNAGAAGASSATAAGTPSIENWYNTIGGSGGVANYAVRKNGHTVSVTNNGTITGAVG